MKSGFRMARWVGITALLGLITAFSSASAQVETIQRIAGMVAIAADEYGKAFDPQGRMVSVDEYQEAVVFLGEARASAGRLPSERLGAAAILDSMIAAVNAKRPVAEIKGLASRFAGALGSAAALDLPRQRLNPDSGGRIYASTCAGCHGVRGLGDGPLSVGMNPPPAAVGDPVFMRAAAPSMMFQKVSVGVAGTTMPAYGDKLSAEDRWNVVAYMTELRHRNVDAAHGEGLYGHSCASCHGMNGRGDGALARELSKLPPAIGTFAWQAARSDSEMVAVIRNGVPGSPMPPIRTMTPLEEQEIVAYLRSIAVRRNPAGGQETDSNDATGAAARSLNFLEQSLSAARAGRTDDAGDRATDAYIAFEPVETRSRPKNPGLVLTMEQTYQRFKAAVKSGNIRAAEQEQARIEGTMPSVLALTKPTGSGFEAFWQSFLIILREGFEAILVVGAVVTFLLKTGHRERLKSIWVGVGAALVASAITAVVLKTVLSSIPASREIIEGATMLIAVAVLFSVSYWLISRVEAAKWQQFIKDKVSVALEHGGGRALAIVAFLAVYREGAETALFYQALLNEGTNIMMPILLGIVVGFAALAVIFTLFYRFGVRIPLRPFFGATSILLYYMAFVFMGKGIKELQEGNAVSATFIRFPTIDWLGIYPTWETLIGQMALLVLLAFALIKTFWPSRSVALPTVPVVAPQLEELMARVEALEKRVGA
ncbi:MAG TPA: FTR1 family protein [Gemmatimonadaceae bacterium]|nr:FTR1 family protein [Gemmatimonadaceae bacterium]